MNIVGTPFSRSITSSDTAMTDYFEDFDDDNTDTQHKVSKEPLLTTCIYTCTDIIWIIKASAQKTTDRLYETLNSTKREIKCFRRILFIVCC